uniref:CSON015024 protein n=1 Tax=Culicoides sonorensis TaxID=179676 RepID=A0A336MF26_CULSO
MATTPEIITLQFGNYANYCGTHWWNIQEAQFNYDPLADPSDINHDVLFREGQTFKGETTFTPRMLLVDLKGSLTNFPQEGDLYSHTNNTIDQIKSDVQWDESKIQVLNDQMGIDSNESNSKSKVNEYLKNLNEPDVDPDSKNYNFNEIVTEWSDFQYSKYHPRSVNVIKDYQHDVDETSFDTFMAGWQVWKQSDMEDDFGDKIRNMIEECDFCQGFQILFDAIDGFSGLATKCSEHLEDEYGKSILCVPIFAPKARKFKNCDGAMNDSIRLMNIALTFSQLSESCSMFIPLSTMNRVWRGIENPKSFSLLNYIADNFYQTSAIIATYLDTISLRYRLRHPSGTSFLSNFCTEMNRYGRKMAAAGIALPFKMNENEDLIEYLDRVEGPLFDSLSPNCEVGTDYVIQIWKQSDMEDEFCDKIRNMIEECDFCQGFQILFDAIDGFSGLATKCSEHLEDEYGKSILCVPIFAPKARKFKNCDGAMNDSIRLMNIALTLSQLSESCSMFIPLSTMNRVWRGIENPKSFSLLNYTADNFYQTSAIIATYLDTISLRYRLRHPSGTSYLSNFCTEMNRYGKKMAAAGIALPFKMNENEDLIEYLDRVEGPLFDSLSPNCEVGTDYVIQSICLRGTPESRLKKSRETAGNQLQMAAYKCGSVSEMIQLYYQCSYHKSCAHVTTIEEPFKVKTPYPREFLSKNLNKHGFLTIESDYSKIESMPLLANVQVSKSLGFTLEALHRDTKRIKFGKIHRFKESGMEQDEYEEAMDFDLIR